MQPQNYLDPQLLARLQGLQLRARLIVEGYVAGVHRSPFHGFSIEFAEHREYAAGDDLRYLDWKVLGRTDKYYLKQFEEETNLVCQLLVDTSQSMAYRSEAAAMSKLEYAKCAAAALAYLILQQQDSVGLVTFDHEIRAWCDPAATPRTSSRSCTCWTTRPANAKPPPARFSTTWPSVSRSAASSWCSATCSTTSTA